MIPVSFLAGISEALIYPAMSLYSVYFATQYAELGCNNVTEYVNMFAGKFFSIVFLTHASYLYNYSYFIIYTRTMTGDIEKLSIHHCRFLEICSLTL